MPDSRQQQVNSLHHNIWCKKKNMLNCDMCGDGSIENRKTVHFQLYLCYLWLPSVTVGTMVMFSSGLKRGRREPYHVLTNVSLWKPVHSTTTARFKFIQLSPGSKHKTVQREISPVLDVISPLNIQSGWNYSSVRISYCLRWIVVAKPNNVPPSALHCKTLGA